MIPRIIHQTYKWKTRLPPTYARCQHAIRKLHPDWEYRFWTDEDMMREVREEWPELWPAFQALPRQIMRIDVFRYCLMYRYGGLYADLDYLFLRPFDLLDDECVLPKSRENRFGNCVFASAPGHPFWLTLIRDIIDHPRNESSDNDVCDGPDGTGPGFVTRIYNAYPDKDRICTPARVFFHPPASDPKEQSYGQHLCLGVWRENAL